MNNLNRIKLLFEKYLNRTASSEELDEMFHILRNKSDFEALHDLFEKEWESEDVQFYLDNTSWEEMQPPMDDRKKVNPLNNPTIAKDNNLFWKFAGIAASVLILVGLSFWIVKSPGDQLYQTGYGETLEITLDDNSHIILNANSKLIWHSGWKNARERVVELEGEAFFDVSHQFLHQKIHLEPTEDTSALMPFRVNTPDLTVNVLGTSFNVMARRQTTDVYLESGRVVLTTNNVQNSNTADDFQQSRGIFVDSEKDSIYMMPGDHVSYSGHTTAVAEFKAETDQNQSSWANGHLVFENQPLKSALQELEDIYGKNFEVEDSTLLERTVDLGLPYEDWETVSGLMTLSLEIEFIETENKVIVKRK